MTSARVYLQLRKCEACTIACTSSGITWFSVKTLFTGFLSFFLFFWHFNVVIRQIDHIDSQVSTYPPVVQPPRSVLHWT